MFHVRGLLCLLAFLPAHSTGAPIAVSTMIKQTQGLLSLLRAKARPLLTTYLEQLGSPFSDPDFAMPELQLEGLPVAKISYAVWRHFSDEARLASNYRAYTLYLAFLQLVLDDQQALGPSLGPGRLQEQLVSVRAQTEGLVSNLGSILAAMGHQKPEVHDPMTSESYDPTNFERKVRGYVICREYVDWIKRTERDMMILSR
ncbi:cardiotrophin-2-like [Heptranchias perlo]|uniref:cardiotrophin-2-like n=1 Tax=Heptranchias perlo TaxID=212740 RepID=UPI003559D55A